MSAQYTSEFGELTQIEKQFKSYDKDTTAHAVYLFDKGENYFEVRGSYIWLIKNTMPRKKYWIDRVLMRPKLQFPIIIQIKGKNR